MDLLPEELLADILQRLQPQPRHLAVCRSVCKALRAVIDGRGLLLAFAHRVPRGLRGIFINYTGQEKPYFFSRGGSSAPRIDGELSFLPRIGWREFVHHCNGLVLFHDWNTLNVCNPATRRWQQLPPAPCYGDTAAHLAFDPTVSLHYDVFFFPEVPPKPKIPVQPGIKRSSVFQCLNKYRKYYAEEEIKNLPLPSSLRAKYDHETQIKGSIEWPPPSYVAQVFSSRTGQWEERTFLREGDVAVTVSDVWSDPWAPGRYHAPRCNGVYWRGAFYLHCRGGFIVRLSLIEQRYKVIKTPRLENVFVAPRLDVNDFLREECSYRSKETCLRDFQERQEGLDNLPPSMHLGKSEHGIYYTAVRWHQLQVWALLEASESRPIPEWELKHKADIEPSFWQHYKRHDKEGIMASWFLDCGKIESKDIENRGWDSSDDSGINVEEQDVVNDNDFYCDIESRMDFLGYHPSKEIVFLGNHFDGFAYYLGSSKLQYLGSFEPFGCIHKQVAATHECFIYTPCMDDSLLTPADIMNSKEGLEDFDDEEYLGGQDENLSEVEDMDEEDLEVEDDEFEFSEEDLMWTMLTIDEYKES